MFTVQLSSFFRFKADDLEYSIDILPELTAPTVCQFDLLIGTFCSNLVVCREGPVPTHSQLVHPECDGELYAKFKPFGVSLIGRNVTSQILE